MLKYHLKKEFTLLSGMAFRYDSILEFESLITAIKEHYDIKLERNESLISGLLIIGDTHHGVTTIKQRKYLIAKYEYKVKKKHIFNKTEYDNGPKNNKGSVGQYDNASNLREQTDVNNNGGPVKAEISVHDCGFSTSTSQTCGTTAEPNKPFVAYAITDGCGFRVPVNRVQETLPKLKSNEGAQGFFDMLHSIKTIVVDGKVKNEIGSFEEATSLDGKTVLIYTRKNGSKVIIE